MAISRGKALLTQMTRGGVETMNAFTSLSKATCVWLMYCALWW